MYLHYRKSFEFYIAIFRAYIVPLSVTYIQKIQNLRTNVLKFPGSPGKNKDDESNKPGVKLYAY